MNCELPVAVCNDVCLMYKANRPRDKVRYESGKKRCSYCGIFLIYDGLSCPCCGTRLQYSGRYPYQKTHVKRIG